MKLKNFLFKELCEMSRRIFCRRTLKNSCRHVMNPFGSAIKQFSKEVTRAISLLGYDGQSGEPNLQGLLEEDLVSY